MATEWSGGHSASILCIQAAGGEDGLLASGAEGGEVTLWSQDGIVIGQLRLRDQEDVTSAVFSKAAPGLLYVSHGETVTVLDPRRLKEPVSEFSGVGEEEINGLSLNDAGTLLAAGDDSGAVRVVELQSGKVSRTLRRHTNICSSVAFRPQRPNSLVSAGLDMQVLLWNLQKTRPVWAVSLQEEAAPNPSEGRSQLVNPALVHHVGVSSCGDMLACACEDGRVCVLRVGAGSRLAHRAALEAHSHGASQAHFLPFPFLPHHPYCLLSAGHDCTVALWDLSAHAQERRTQERSGNAHSGVGGGGGSSTRVTRGKRGRGRGRGGSRAQQTTTTHPANSPHTTDPTHTHTAPPAGVEGESLDSVEGNGESVCEGDGVCDGKSVCDGESVCEASAAKPSGPVLRFSHSDKLNWACPALLQGKASVLVADQSCNLSVYTLPPL